MDKILERLGGIEDNRSSKMAQSSKTHQTMTSIHDYLYWNHFTL